MTVIFNDCNSKIKLMTVIVNHVMTVIVNHLMTVIVNCNI